MIFSIIEQPYSLAIPAQVWFLMSGPARGPSLVTNAPIPFPKPWFGSEICEQTARHRGYNALKPWRFFQRFDALNLEKAVAHPGLLGD